MRSSLSDDNDDTTTTTNTNAVVSLLTTADASWAYHNEHCIKCVNLIECIKKNQQQQQKCPLISCPNKCAFSKMHACKLEEHLSETCPNESIECVNRTNGC